MAKQRLLVIGAGTEALPGLRRARDMGYYVVATDGNPHAPGFVLADEHLTVSTYDVEATVEAIRHYRLTHEPFAGVIALAADVPITVATVAASQNLPGVPIEVARVTSDKLAMKAVLAAADIPLPWYSPVESPTHLHDLLQAQGRPLILKPVDSRGARGVIRLTADIGLPWAFAQAQAHSPTGRVMVEEYLAGPQVSTETVLHGTWGVTPAFIDRNYARLEEYAPYVLEDGGEQPSHLSEQQVVTMKALAYAAAKALGITNATAKGDLVLTPEGPKVIEMAARLSGGYMSSIQVPLSTGVDLVGIAIRLACGEAVTASECIPTTAHGVAIRYCWPRPGRVTALHTYPAAMIPGVYALRIYASIGEVITAPTRHAQRAGWVITQGATRDEAVRQAEAAIQAIDITTRSLDDA